jgi:ureidoglycolate hydrolase
MDENLLEIRKYDGAGYQPLIDYGAWRVAILRWEQSMLPEKMEFMERHTQTDEVFVLLNGQATLILGGNNQKAEGMYQQMMEKGKLYNVKRNAWHTIMLSRDASILIVENQDTGENNTEYNRISEECKQEILSLSNGV